MLEQKTKAMREGPGAQQGAAGVRSARHGELGEAGRGRCRQSERKGVALCAAVVVCCV